MPRTDSPRVARRSRTRGCTAASERCCRSTCGTSSPPSRPDACSGSSARSAIRRRSRTSSRGCARTSCPSWRGTPCPRRASTTRGASSSAARSPRPTSPALANLAAFGLDRRLRGFAERFGLRYSRYADDLTLSGSALTGKRSATLAGYAARIAREEGFALQPRKSRLRTAARTQLVTGIVVNVHPNLPRAEYDRLRATLHRLAMDGPPPSGAEIDLQAQLRGRVAWAESLNPERGAKLQRLFEAIDWG